MCGKNAKNVGKGLNDVCRTSKSRLRRSERLLWERHVSFLEDDQEGLARIFPKCAVLNSEENVTRALGYIATDKTEAFALAHSLD